jgi:hypothetical protein
MKLREPSHPIRADDDARINPPEMIRRKEKSLTRILLRQALPRYFSGMAHAIPPLNLTLLKPDQIVVSSSKRNTSPKIRRSFLASRR